MQQTISSESLNRQEFLRRLTESKLLSPADLERAANLGADTDALALASCLVNEGLLTAFQLEAIYQDRTGDLQIGNYDVLDKLGAGGMGTVFKARHRRMKRVVALKVLSRNLCQDENFVLRFQREVETIARLSHPNIVMAYDADEGEVGHFLVMEFVQGQDLASLVQKQGPLSVAAAVDCVLQAARGLDYAHGQQIIHRDIKPANLLRDTNGTVKVTDLGLARLSTALGAPASGQSALTQAGGILGTVDYMPPEQAVDSASIDHRADIYSLGATLHFLLFGNAPYLGSTMMAVLLKHREAPIPSLSASRPDVPPALDALFRRMMAKTPGDRCQTMAEAVRELAGVQALVPCALDADKARSTSIPLAGQPAHAMTTVGQKPEMTFVASQASAAQTVEHRPPSTAHGKPLAVLLVESSRTQAGIIRKYLQIQRIENVVTAATGQDALKLIRTHRPDVMLSSMHFSDMTGIQLAKLVREEFRQSGPGFVLISSESESKEAGSLSKSGLAVLLQKPFSPEQLIQALSLASPLAGAAEPLPVAKTDRSKCRVLIVDDSPPARLHVRSVLSGLGFTQFAEATDGAQGVAILARETFDLVITDYNMPLMDGHSLVGYLRQNPSTATVPIIMVTTENDLAKLDAVRRLGVVVCDKSLPREVVQGILDGMS